MSSFEGYSGLLKQNIEIKLSRAKRTSDNICFFNICNNYHIAKVAIKQNSIYFDSKFLCEAFTGTRCTDQ